MLGVFFIQAKGKIFIFISTLEQFYSKMYRLLILIKKPILEKKKPLPLMFTFKKIITGAALITLQLFF
jgi:hypothetical protein